MKLRDSRSRSQILFNLLPWQTVDLRGRIWRVKEWVSAEYIHVDEQRLRATLIGELEIWKGRDNGFAEGIRRGYEVKARAVNMEQGVSVVPFPKTFQCKTCRVMSDTGRQCAFCGGRSFGQVSFVGYHECGRIFEPRIDRCPKHGMARINHAPSARAADIRFDCPTCGLVLQRGLGVRVCECGTGPILYLPHRAGSVYRPQMITLVNPASRDAVRRLNDRGGAVGALRRILSEDSDSDDGGLTSYAEMQERLKDLPEAVRSAMLAEAVRAGAVRPMEADPDLRAVPVAQREEAEAEAIEVDLALDGGRLQVSDLPPRWGTAQSAIARSESYRRSITRAGLSMVDLCDHFPILRAVYGYTRGDETKAILQPFRNKNEYVVHADNGVTEALLFRLNPQQVVDWLRTSHPDFRHASGSTDARVAILERASVPRRYDDPQGTIGDDLVTLIHTFSHRIIRRLSVFAGIDRDALGEHLLPSHASFFIFAQPRGDFVLGGLQAVFESELDKLLIDFVEAERRCPLDPGCHSSLGACPACLHVGEPTCRWFNRRLNRHVLFGPEGYLALS